MIESITKAEDSINYDGHRNFGLTKREYFAAKALIGILSNSSTSNSQNQNPLSHGSCDQHCELAVKYAETLIKYLNLNK